MPALDSLAPTENRISPVFTPNAPIQIGSSPPSTASQAVPLLKGRSRHLSDFHHLIHIAWDIDVGRHEGSIQTTYNSTALDEQTAQKAQPYAPLVGNIQMKRTIMFEATS
jgi:hypothetical protein